MTGEKPALPKDASFPAAAPNIDPSVNLEFKDIKSEKCEYCGQLKYGIARKFREFLLKYVGTAQENKPKFNSFYSLRSKIVHTGELLKNERLFSGLPKYDRDLELLTQIEILQMGKLSIINWLVQNGKSL